MSTVSDDIGATTSEWVRNASDELAAANGCQFDASRGAYSVWWIERYCRLYEGVEGAPLLLRGCHECGTYDLPAATEFQSWGDDACEVFVERARLFTGCVREGHAIDWQYDCTMRLFSWVRWSEQWARLIRRFRQGSIWVAKKNKKSPTLAAYGHHLLSGDGEPGQKVFVAAKDGTQSRKTVEHAVQMLYQSEDLQAECKLNLNTYRITHFPSRSSLEPLSSSNKRTQESKEGLNGSVLVDETHVVDREFMNRITRAGISRSEPLRIEVSTAGNNPDSYGKERFDYALQVRDGVQENQELFAAVYAAPQDLTDADLDADPLKYGRMANPAMSHTVDPEEFLDDYRTSKRSIGTLLDFKMYRLNIWQRAVNPWLKAGDWARCQRVYTEDDLAGRTCFAALDLSRTKDMTSLVLIFSWEEDGPETFRYLHYFWLPRERVEEIAHQVSVLEWERAGALEVTPGGVIDYGFIKARFRALAQKFHIKELAYDPRFAEEVTQSLEQGTVGEQGAMVEEGTGVPRFVFTQNDNNFAAPTADFERLVISGKLQHNGHPVLTWQVGHAVVITRASKVKRVVKPSKDPNDPRTVDGVVAGIMALGMAIKEPSDAFWYATAGGLRG